MTEDSASQELATQPALWLKASARATAAIDALPAPGERVAVLGCGTSLYMGQAYAELREQHGAGETDAFPASAHRWGRDYDRLLVITRSGTTTEILDALRRNDGGAPSVVMTTAPTSPAAELADAVIALPEAAERSVIQTRSATMALAILRAALGEDLRPIAGQAQRSLEDPLPLEAGAHPQLVFLGAGWAAAIANEAALKCREAGGWWAEAYLGTEFRHGPISACGPHTAVWVLGDAPVGLIEEIRAIGSTVVATGRDPVADLVAVQRLAVALARFAGRDPDRPPALSFSVVLPS